MRVINIDLDTTSGRASVTVKLQRSEPFFTPEAPQIGNGLLLLFPGIRLCRNYGGEWRFEQEVEDTPIPHCLMFLLLELQCKAHHHQMLHGITHWDWREDDDIEGVFYIDVDYENESLILAAIPVACRIISRLSRFKIEEIDVEKELAYLRYTAQHDKRRNPPGAKARGLLERIKELQVAETAGEKCQELITWLSNSLQALSGCTPNTK